MLLTVLGFVMIATFLTLIMTKKMSPMTSLILIPALFCVIAGQGAHLGEYVLEGIGELAPTAAMLMFAIIYFGVMIDVGLFDPIVRGILRFCKADPARVVLGTAVLAAIVSLDGDGSTTFMITVSAMLPLYLRLKMSVLTMTMVTATANGVMNTVPWGGPTARAATALKLDAGDIFVPMVPAFAIGLLSVFALAWILGLRERRRLGLLTESGPASDTVTTTEDEEAGAETRDRTPAGVGAGSRTGSAGATATRTATGPAATTGSGGTATPDLAKPGTGGDSGDGPAEDGEGGTLDPNRPTLRPKLFWFNALLTLAVLVTLVAQLLPIPVIFMFGAALALTVNFPHMKQQRERIAAHADNVLNVSGMVFAAAVFTGVLTGTGMVEEMAKTLVGAVPDSLGPHMALITGLLSIPFTYFMSNDGFYFGIVPILAEAGAQHGVSPLEIARASLIAQPLHMSSPLVPAVYVLVGMAKVEFGDHTRATVKWAVMVSLVILAAALLLGIA
ncbi:MULTISPECIES: CitMHS family transporter [Streptomyces]|uniref:Citrate:proton symporter n=1 Tax=Streptomyces albidoflavus TaxID=1886 RepID=A0AA37C1G2_9ACTN|nr:MULTISPECIES: citrate:proton symporter [Streptomyces]MBV7254063.1 citrate:proton symporter [Streptomyces sp. S-2]RZE23490.1 citrate:proton symporter [Streptomyces albidoflavus]RZE51265.1 citrate:proton symporter [Streptomyces albidoflavus]WJK68549.1 citrate:proton symporter [Streptomyces albidoflavus]WQG73977.1 citrate:proton symporter [Streptomyces albidoflavus]